ncbi:hypothetical protein CROQUDRAFT_671352 [Cronartium quercuum f. sp. fusiforme G11]|uniref:Uncharacterized protein n=1 Tax=Cronartium quercuum f. sp. fusiforme G11 TaxID=708437 RepID=A0A9P6NLF2_9BASI|nr:hypothetical protein CROQUDRAFT_671352 [Cronartium quercuum f. sp. fusiforme G11]
MSSSHFNLNSQSKVPETTFKVIHDIKSSLAQVLDSLHTPNQTVLLNYFSPPLHRSLRLHPIPISPVKLTKSKQSIINSLLILKQSLLDFNQLILDPIIALNQSEKSNHHLHFPKLFALLRESTRGVTYLINAKVELKQTNEILKLNSNTKFKRKSTYIKPNLIVKEQHDHNKENQNEFNILILIEKVTKEIGLEAFLDSEDLNLLMIVGKVMLIDIEIIKKQDQNKFINVINKCKFSYSFGNEIETRRDELIDIELFENLKNLHLFNESNNDCLEKFGKTLRRLKEFDELIDYSQQIKKNHNLEIDSMIIDEKEKEAGPIDYFMMFRNLINSFWEKYEEDLNILSHSRNEQYTRLPIYGIPISNRTSFELIIGYHFSSTILLKTQSIQELQSKIKSANYSIDTRILSINFNHIDSNFPNLPLFVATFDPPLLLSKSNSLEIFRIFKNYNHSNTTTNLIMNQNDPNDPILNLDDLLVTESLSNKIDSNQLSKLICKDKWRNDQFSHKFEFQPKQIYSCTKSHFEQEISECNKPEIGFVTHKIDFNDFKELFQIIKIVKRQAILNEIFQSCFSSRHLNPFKSNHPTLQELLSGIIQNFTLSPFPSPYNKIDHLFFFSKNQMNHL